MSIKSKILAFYEKWFFRKDFHEKQLLPERVTEISCFPVYWKFIDSKHELILEWDMQETIQLIDKKKENELRIDHLAAENQGKSRKEVWASTLRTLNHISQYHFDEVKIDIPKDNVSAIATSDATVVGVKNILTNEIQLFKLDKRLVAGDMLIATVRFVEWDVINMLGCKGVPA